jgi:hypothetical protein
LSIVRSGAKVCLLCFERDVAHCHRQRIAEVVQKQTGAAIRILAPPLF